MAILIDGRAREVIAHRQQRGRRVSVDIHVQHLRHGTHVLLAEITGSRKPRANQTEAEAGDVHLFVDRRVARYAQWRDITISAQHLGPLHYLIVLDELPILFDMASWERTHPGIGRAGASAAVPARMTA